MTAPNRTSIIEKLQKNLRKHYKAPPAPPERDLLRQFLYALILEHASFEKADQAFARLEQSAFDWNEVRVTTTAELVEWMAGVLDARQAAVNLKRFLHSVFESQYSFELDALKKQNLGKAQSDLAKFTGASPFAVNYVTQHVLGGHAIPLRHSAYEVLFIVGILDAKERAAQSAGRLDRAISKKSGVEFAALLHQLAIDFAASPYSPRVRTILLEINPEAKDRLPKRVTKKPVVAPPVASDEPAKKGGAEAAPKSGKPAKAKGQPARKTAVPQKARPAAKKSVPGKSTPHTKAAKKPAARKKALTHPRIHPLNRPSHESR